MPVCRVYLCTYRRPKLLHRALSSLLSQTFTDWVCELHNDDPNDPFPRELAQSIGDSRITTIDHAENLGAIRTFNLVFRSVEEPFFTLLEDDNWWEPDFLQTMVSAMSSHPEVQVGWANMRLWEEQDDGTWRDTGRNIWDNVRFCTPQLMSWPDRRQLSGALHSNGAMLAKSGFQYYPVPESINFAAIEPFRERTFVHPLMFVPKRLANFAVTRTTARPSDAANWTHAVAVLSGTYLSEVGMSEDQLLSIWCDARKSPRSTHVLFICVLHFKKCRQLLKYASFNDWLWTCGYVGRHPIRFLNVLRLFRDKGQEEAFLFYHTRRRQQEAAAKSLVTTTRGG